MIVASFQTREASTACYLFNWQTSDQIPGHLESSISNMSSFWRSVPQEVPSVALFDTSVGWDYVFSFLYSDIFPGIYEAYNRYFSKNKNILSESKWFRLILLEDYRMLLIPEEGWRVQSPKRCDKDKNN